MKLEDLTLKEIVEIASAIKGSNQSDLDTKFWIPGRKYFIRTVTHHHTGELVVITQQEIILTKAAWIADDGRLTDSLKNGAFNEVEMFPTGNVLIGRGSIIDAVEITSIPTSQK